VRIGVPLYRAVGGLLILVAVGYQLSRSVANGFSAVSFFSYFTILSNLFAAVVLLLGVAWFGRDSARFDSVRGAAVVYLATTGITFALLLRDLAEEVQTTTPWVDTVLHRMMPLVVVLDWLIDPPRRRLEARRVWWWLLFPLLYLPYTLLRGPVVDWYPYPFLDPRPHGYGPVAVASVGVAVGIVVLALLTAVVGNRVRALRDRPTPAPAPADEG
jgi:hypothetical protein